jgi:hypothetical protein
MPRPTLSWRNGHTILAVVVDRPATAGINAPCPLRRTGARVVRAWVTCEPAMSLGTHGSS